MSNFCLWQTCFIKLLSTQIQPDRTVYWRFACTIRCITIIPSLSLFAGSQAVCQFCLSHFSSLLLLIQQFCQPLAEANKSVTGSFLHSQRCQCPLAALSQRNCIHISLNHPLVTFCQMFFSINLIYFCLTCIPPRYFIHYLQTLYKIRVKYFREFSSHKSLLSVDVTKWCKSLNVILWQKKMQ